MIDRILKNQILAAEQQLLAADYVASDTGTGPFFLKKYVSRYIQE